MSNLPVGRYSKPHELTIGNISKRVSDTVTNPALSYINSLSASSSYGGRVGARSSLERFCRHFLGPSSNLVDWAMLITDTHYTERALAGYFLSRAKNTSKINNTVIDDNDPYYNVHMKPLRDALLAVTEHFRTDLTLDGYIDKWLFCINSRLQCNEYIYSSNMSPMAIRHTINTSMLNNGQKNALESFSCFMISTCIERFEWNKFLYAPIVKAMMSEYLEVGIIKDGHKIDDYKPATADNLYRMLTGVAEHHWLAENMTVERLQRVKAIKLARGSRKSSGRYIHFHDYDMIIDIINSHPNEIRVIRDKALISCLFYLGLRRHEVVNLKLKNIDWEAGFITVVGKGNKERDVPFDLDDDFNIYLKDWLRTLSEHFLEREPDDFIFTAVTKSKVPTPKKLGSQSINDICKWIIDNGLSKSISPHDFRHTVATNLLAQGVDLLSVSKMLGHASPTTTQRYDQRDRDQLRKATIKRNV